MTRKKVAILDDEFVHHSKSASLGGPNTDVSPRFIEWVPVKDPKEALVVTDRNIKRSPGMGQIALLLEPSALHPENYIEALKRYYDYVLTHEKDFAERFENWLYYPFGGTWIKKWGSGEKNKGCSFIFNANKNTLAGHKLRHKVYEEVKDTIDCYGRGHNDIASKKQGLADYLFSIVIESNQANGYFTEKLIDCFACRTMPIYWGAPDIGKHFDERGMMFFDVEWGFLPKVIIKGLIKGGEYNYQLHQPYFKENVRRAREFTICEDNIYRLYPELFT